MPESKSYPVQEFKALGGDDGPGSFEALVAVFGNVDHGGDRIQRGAFKDSLADWKARNRSIPVLWSHDTETVPLGVVTEAVENSKGLRVKAKLLIEDHPQAKAVYAAMKAGALHEFSFAYQALDHEHTTEDGQQIRDLKRLNLLEVSPVFRGMNPATHLMGVKSIGDLERQRSELEEQLAEVNQKLSALTDDPEVAEAIEVAAKGAIHQTTELDDKPDPKPEEGEEGRARIAALMVAHPEHTE